MPRNFALLGAAGYIAPRHLRAIADTGHELVAACDPHDSVRVLDGVFPNAAFFTEVERFDRFLEKRRRASDAERVHYVSVCSPNYLHDAHVRLALRVGADAICEKPLVINPWNLDQLEALEAESGRRVHTVLQLRLLPALAELRRAILADPTRPRAQVELTYVTSRGRWYHVSWKGQADKSGGLAMNIGIHLFDLVLWLFGAPQRSDVHLVQPDKMAGLLSLERADVRWFLSVDASDLPASARAAGKNAFRALVLDGRELEFSEGFAGLHTEVYRRVLAGEGPGLREARPSLELAYRIRTATPKPSRDAHPLTRSA